MAGGITRQALRRSISVRIPILQFKKAKEAPTNGALIASVLIVLTNRVSLSRTRRNYINGLAPIRQ